MRFPARLKASASSRLKTFRATDLLGAGRFAAKAFIVIDFAGQGISARNDLFLTEYKKCDLDAAKINVAVARGEKRKLRRDAEIGSTARFS